ncbi:unnamed protein product [Arctogadus glacialis]
MSSGWLYSSSAAPSPSDPRRGEEEAEEEEEEGVATLSGNIHARFHPVRQGERRVAGARFILQAPESPPPSSSRSMPAADVIAWQSRSI